MRLEKFWKNPEKIWLNLAKIRRIIDAILSFVVRFYLWPHVLYLFTSTCGRIQIRWAVLGSVQMILNEDKWISEPISSHLHILRIVSTGFEFTFNLIHVLSYSWARWYNSCLQNVHGWAGGILIVTIIVLCVYFHFFLDLSGARNSAARSPKLRPATLSEYFLGDVKEFTHKSGKASAGMSVQTLDNIIAKEEDWWS